MVTRGPAGAGSRVVRTEGAVSLDEVWWFEVPSRVALAFRVALARAQLELLSLVEDTHSFFPTLVVS